MTARSALRVSRPLRAVGLTMALVLAAASLAGARPAHLPSPRVGNLHARVSTLEARVATLQPRTVSVAPKRTRPNTFNVNTDILFAFDRSTVSPDAKAVLANVVDQLKKAKPGSVSIVGYTDSIGTRRFNLGLSRRRASSVESYLRSSVRNGGLAYRTKGLGEADPVAPNKLSNGQDNPAGRQKNRRVVITYTRT